MPEAIVYYQRLIKINGATRITNRVYNISFFSLKFTVVVVIRVCDVIVTIYRFNFLLFF